MRCRFDLVLTAIYCFLSKAQSAGWLSDSIRTWERAYRYFVSFCEPWFPVYCSKFLLLGLSLQEVLRDLREQRPQKDFMAFQGDHRPAYTESKIRGKQEYNLEIQCPAGNLSLKRNNGKTNQELLIGSWRVGKELSALPHIVIVLVHIQTLATQAWRLHNSVFNSQNPLPWKQASPSIFCLLPPGFSKLIKKKKNARTSLSAQWFLSSLPWLFKATFDDLRNTWLGSSLHFLQVKDRASYTLCL